jgi:HD-GYP domain-containing protein (c-di-GMP phosphodiesterase class II)
LKLFGGRKHAISSVVRPLPMILGVTPAVLERSAAPALAFDARADETVGEHRDERATALSRSERLALCVIGGSFLATAIVLTVLIPSDRNPGLAVIALYIAVYALVSRVEFEIFTGASVPTELVLVPLLFVLPLNLAALAVAGGLMLGSLVDWGWGRIPLERGALNLIGSCHTLGPVLVLWLTGSQAIVWSHWPVFAAALLAQFAVELPSVAAAERIARGTGLRELLPHVGRAQLVDATLAPVGLVLAFAAQSEPYTLVLVLPLVWLLKVFARERRARIDNALELSNAYRGTAFLLGDVVEADDAYTGLHSRDVVALSLAVADCLGLSGQERRDTEFVALLHDVGKIRIPGAIINKPGKLTAEERALMETHTIEGAQMLERVGGLLGSVGRIVRSCHERWDGDGYPDGLEGEAIPRVARIVMCCDAYSAMTSDRSYRKALSREVAITELRANAGTQFEPAVVDALIAVIDEGAAERRL